MKVKNIFKISLTFLSFFIYSTLFSQYYKDSIWHYPTDRVSVEYYDKEDSTFEKCSYTPESSIIIKMKTNEFVKSEVNKLFKHKDTFVLSFYSSAWYYSQYDLKKGKILEDIIIHRFKKDTLVFINHYNIIEYKKIWHKFSKYKIIESDENIIPLQYFNNVLQFNNTNLIYGLLNSSYYMFTCVVVFDKSKNELKVIKERVVKLNKKHIRYV